MSEAEYNMSIAELRVRIAEIDSGLVPDTVYPCNRPGPGPNVITLKERLESALRDKIWWEQDAARKARRNEVRRNQAAELKRLRAEVAALKARPAMPWRRRDQGDDLGPGHYLAVIKPLTGPRIVHAIVSGGKVRAEGFEWEMHKVTHYIHWSDLTPPDDSSTTETEDAS